MSLDVKMVYQPKERRAEVDPKHCLTLAFRPASSERVSVSVYSAFDGREMSTCALSAERERERGRWRCVFNDCRRSDTSTVYSRAGSSCESGGCTALVWLLCFGIAAESCSFSSLTLTSMKTSTCRNVPRFCCAHRFVI